MMTINKFVRKNYFKILIGGDGGVGKTTLSKRLAGNLNLEANIEMTPGIDFHSLKIKNDVINITIIDLGGQEQFRTFQEDLLQGASVVVLVFAVDMYRSFVGLSKWLDLFPESMKKDIFLLGNKIDNAHRSVPIDEALEFAESHDMDYYEVSAVNGVGFDDFKYNLISRIEKIFAKY